MDGDLKEELIYAEDVVEMFRGKVSYQMLLKMVREKQIKAVKLGRRYVFSKSFIQTWIRNKFSDSV